MARATLRQKLTDLEIELSPEARYRDLAVQLVVFDRKKGKLIEVDRSNVVGGVWDFWLCRYTGEQPEKIHEISVSRKQLKIVRAVLNRDTKVLLHCGRGFGKTQVASICLLLAALIFPFGFGMVLGPTHSKTKLLWDRITGALPTEIFLEGNGKKIADRELHFITGFKVRFVTGDHEGAVRGPDNDIVIIDERQNVKQRVVGAAELTLRRPSGVRLLQMGTPDLASEFHDEYRRYKAYDPDAAPEDERINHVVDGSTSFDNPFIPHKVFKAAKQNDERFYRQEVLGEWVVLGERVYFAFDREKHVREWTAMDRRRDITRRVLQDRFGEDADYLIGVDYNAAPMIAIVCKVLSDGNDGTLFAVDEVVIERDATADRLGKKLIEAGYGNAIICDDASGQYSKGGVSSSSQLINLGFTVIHNSRNPYIVDRIASVNAKIETAEGRRSLIIAPRCKTLIQSQERQRVAKNGKPDKKEGYDHPNDALGYPIYQVWPVVVSDTWYDQAA